MRGGRLNTGFKLDRPHVIQPEPVGKVGEVRVIRNELHAFQWPGHHLPLPDLGIQLYQEILQIRLELFPILRKVRRQPFRNRLRDQPAVLRIEVEMGIASRMQLSFCPAKVRGNLFGSHLERHVNIPGIPLYDS